MKAAVVNNTLTGPMKGGFYENLVARMLAAAGRPLRYWRSQNGVREIELPVDENVNFVPIEVKAGRGGTVSPNALSEEPGVAKGYKLIHGNIGKHGRRITLPST